jgi:hypothetical protein
MKYVKKFESTIPQNSLSQLKRVADMCKSTDIGQRVGDSGVKYYNIKNILDTKIDTYEDFTKNNSDNK